MAPEDQADAARFRAILAMTGNDVNKALELTSINMELDEDEDPIVALRRAFDTVIHEVENG